MEPTTIEIKTKQKKQEDMNFKKWLLSLASIGNLILGGLLVIMGIQYFTN